MIFQHEIVQKVALLCFRDFNMIFKIYTFQTKFPNSVFTARRNDYEFTGYNKFYIVNSRCGPFGLTLAKSKMIISNPRNHCLYVWVSSTFLLRPNPSRAFRFSGFEKWCRAVTQNFTHIHSETFHVIIHPNL